MKTVTLERLIWVLIYGGLLVLVLGLFVQERVFGFGFSLIVAGGVAAAVGAALIVVRSRIKG
jgi:preprotein translocase subunit SecY